MNHMHKIRIPGCIWLMFILFLFLPKATDGWGKQPSASTNLVPNPDFQLDRDHDGCPDGWRHGKTGADDLSNSRFGCVDFNGHGEKAIWVEGGKDREGEWSCEITGVEPEKDYLLTFWAYRHIFLNRIYPEVEIMGKNFHLDNHCTSRGWQYFQIPVRSTVGMDRTILKFINPYPVRFYFQKPRLIQAVGGREKPMSPLDQISPSMHSHPFPIGIYGASIKDLERIQKAGLNTVIIPSDQKTADAAHELGLNVIFSVPGKGEIPENVQALCNHPALLAWYIADEPEIGPMSPEILRSKLDQLMGYDAKHPSCMAIVRSRFVKHYKDSCHIFMLDQYPIPHRPITWLSDSLDEAREEVGSHRTWAVIQAFGGDEYAAQGWPVFPSYEEMRSLAYLALVHDAQGLFFFSYKAASNNMGRWEVVARVVDELNRLSEWLMQPSINKELPLEVLSPYKVDARGRPAIHFQWKIRKSEAILIMVNTIDKEVEISLDGLPEHVHRAEVLFEKRMIAVKEGNLRDIFGPHQTHVYSIKGLIPKAPRMLSQSFSSAEYPEVHVLGENGIGSLQAFEKGLIDFSCPNLP